ncbi:hypothetical protein HDU97_002319 [Phlyctochytrium planicorne]|nr:hypothetical protein HDU97_002319 [Phlyctochytrium planicorne]
MDPAFQNPTSSFQHLIGKNISNVPKDQLPSVHRIVPEGGMMTMDYRPERINIYVKNDMTPPNRIQSLRQLEIERLNLKLMSPETLTPEDYLSFLNFNSPLEWLHQDSVPLRKEATTNIEAVAPAAAPLLPKSAKIRREVNVDLAEVTSSSTDEAMGCFEDRKGTPVDKESGISTFHLNTSLLRSKIVIHERKYASANENVKEIRSFRQADLSKISTWVQAHPRSTRYFQSRLETSSTKESVPQRILSSLQQQRVTGNGQVDKKVHRGRTPPRAQFDRESRSQSPPRRSANKNDSERRWADLHSLYKQYELGELVGSGFKCRAPSPRYTARRAGSLPRYTIIPTGK